MKPFIAALSVLLWLVLPPVARAQGAAPAGAGGADFPVEPYKSNYVLVWNRDRIGHADGREREEAKYQISFRMWAVQLRYLPLSFGYTQRSFWQVYDKENSRPFRETNYNPELFVDFEDTLLADSRFGLKLGLIEHESNGGRPEISRSWNRQYIQPAVKIAPLRLRAEVKWWRTVGNLEDNPDIGDFFGRAEVFLRRPYGDRAERLRYHTGFELMARQGEALDHPTVALNVYLRWPRLWRWLHFNRGLYLMLQTFHGYGESLIDYDEKVRAYGVGFMFR